MLKSNVSSTLLRKNENKMFIFLTFCFKILCEFLLKSKFRKIEFKLSFNFISNKCDHHNQAKTVGGHVPVNEAICNKLHYNNCKQKKTDDSSTCDNKNSMKKTQLNILHKEE